MSRGRLPLAGKEESEGEAAAHEAAHDTGRTSAPQSRCPICRQNAYPVGRVNEEVLAEVRAIGATTASAPGVHERDTVEARVAALLADPDDPEQRAEFIRWAERTAYRAPTAEMRSAARMLLTLLRDGASPAVLHTVDPPLELHFNPRIALAAAAAVALAVAGGVMAAREVSTPTLKVVGPADGELVGPQRNGRIAFTATGSAALLRRERWSLDGRDVTRLVQRKGMRAVFRPGTLDQGEHEVKVTAAGGLFGARGRVSLDFDVDLTPPLLDVPGPLQATAWQPLTVSGRTDPGARVEVAGRRVAVGANGRFYATLVPPQPRVVTVVATDPAGNSTREQQSLTVEPRRPAAPVRGVHVTAAAWADPALRRGILELIAQHRINSVELDLKDEGGIAGWNPPVALARRIGAAKAMYDLPAVVRRLHALGIHVIGRIVCFRDPILAAAAWHAGRRDEVVQTPSGGEYSGYGGFTNFANPVVRAYNVQLAVTAARDGVDDILYDYVRRPDGPRSSMQFPGLHGSPSRAIVGFLRETRLALRPYHTLLGASVFGVASTRPDEVAQDVPAMARQVDYIAPLVYPSHWGPGEYNVADPNAEPYAIIRRSLYDFGRDVTGTPSRLVPWLQDFSLGIHYGPAQVRAQIDAARRDGVDEFLLWNPDVVYTGAALTPNARPEPGGG
jgi:hypothetical protein